MTVSWVLGGSGLLGRHVVDLARGAGHEPIRVPVQWTDPRAADLALRAGVEQLRERAHRAAAGTSSGSLGPASSVPRPKSWRTSTIGSRRCLPH